MRDVYNLIETYIDFSCNPNIVVAISGGPDSMVLLKILINMRNKYEFKIVCAHVNHNVRKESVDEQAFLKQYCADNDIIFECMRIEEYNKENFHQQARNIRYNFFDNTIKKYDSKYLLTAHHGDDLIETILMRITRGSNLKGYSGFEVISKRNSYNILRPLVYLTKSYILDYAIKNNIPYGVDKSNDKDCYTRNRYRKNILPFLKEEEKNVHLKYLEFSNELLKYEKYIENKVQKNYLNVVSNKEININKFKLLENLIQKKIIERFLLNIYMEDVDLIKKKHVDNIIQLINSNKANASINLPNNIRLFKNYDTLKLNNEVSKSNIYKIELKNNVKIDNYLIKITQNSEDTSNYCIKLDSNEIKLPLYIRNKYVGDKIEVKGLNGSKKIKDIFIDSKISINLRNSYPLLVDSDDKVLWIPGLKKSKYDKSKEEKYDIIIKCYLMKEEKHEKE